MENNFQEYNQEQGIFKVIIPDKLLEKEHPARIIDRVVELLDLSKIYNYYSHEGSPAYHPKMMLKVLFYSYYCGLMSCRNIWDGLKYRSDYLFLSGDQVPDFRTINLFRTRHIEALPDLLSQIVFLCSELGMLDFKNLAIDGQKIQANANFRKSKDREGLKKRYAKVKEGIEKLVKQEPDEFLSEETIDKRVSKLKKEAQKLEDFAETLKEFATEGNKEKKINITDKDASVMKHKNGRSLPSYNHQVAVDEKLGVTVAVNTKDNVDEAADLFPLVDKATENAGSKFENVSADSAFCNYEVLKEVEENRDEDFYIPDKLYEASKGNGTKKGKYSAENFTEQTDGNIICPEEKPMKKKAVNEFPDHTETIYEGTTCESCPAHDKCTKGKKRTISIDSRKPYRDKMREKLNSSEGREIYIKRQGIVEPTNGNDQKNKKWVQHHLRGLSKSALEFMLMRIGSNLGKICMYRHIEMMQYG